MKNLVSAIFTTIMLFASQAAFAGGGFGATVSKDFVGATTYQLFTDTFGLGFDYKFGLDTLHIDNGSKTVGGELLTRWELMDLSAVTIIKGDSVDVVTSAGLGLATKYTLERATSGFHQDDKQSMVNVAISLGVRAHWGGWLGVSYDTAPGSIGGIVGWSW